MRELLKVSVTWAEEGEIIPRWFDDYSFQSNPFDDWENDEILPVNWDLADVPDDIRNKFLYEYDKLNEYDQHYVDSAIYGFKAPFKWYGISLGSPMSEGYSCDGYSALEDEEDALGNLFDGCLKGWEDYIVQAAKHLHSKYGTPSEKNVAKHITFILVVSTRWIAYGSSYFGEVDYELEVGIDGVLDLENMVVIKDLS